MPLVGRTAPAQRALSQSRLPTAGTCARSRLPWRFSSEVAMAKPNYHVPKRQKELARKTRKQEKLERRSSRGDEPASREGADPAGRASDEVQK